MGKRTLTFALACCVLLAAAAPAAGAHASSKHTHADDHADLARAVAAEQRRFARMSRRQKQRLLARRTRVTARAAAVPSSEGGAWSAPFRHRSYGMHSALLHTGKVLFWSLPLGPFGQQENRGLAWLWDPGKGTGATAFKDVDPPAVDLTEDGVANPVPAPLYCSGQSFLPDGRVLAAGGNLRWTKTGTYVGWKGILTFDPVTETWQREPDMAHGRWYPSQVLLADGRTAITAGYDEHGNVPETNNETLEYFEPGGGGAVGRLVRQRWAEGVTQGLYPHLFLLPGGDALLAGPDRGDSALLRNDPWDPAGSYWDYYFGGAATWENRVRLTRQRTGSTAVLMPVGPSGSSRVMVIGGYGGGAAHNDESATASTEVLDARPATGRPAWKPAPSMNIARSYHNTVLLPDGSMVTVGGGNGVSPSAGVRANYDDGRARQVELFDPATQTWKLGAAQAEKRGYHSVALLLADGRVLSAGDDVNPDVHSDNIEVYSPPYLFKGSRPVIAKAPAAVRWGDELGVASGSSVARAVLMGPSATTHGADMTQRHVDLRITKTITGTGVNVVAPPDPSVAPEGYYMLFLLNAKGVPSVARWIRLRPDAADAPSLLELTATPATASRTVGQTHSIAVALRDGTGAGVGDRTVRFAVTGANPRTGATTTAADGTATVSLTATAAGTDSARLWADLDNDGTRDADEPQRTVWVTWTAPSETGGGTVSATTRYGTLTAAPSSAARRVGETHMVAYTLRDPAGAPIVNRTIRFGITGAHPWSRSYQTDADGQVFVSWTGTRTGTDIMTGWFDRNGNALRDTDEPQVTVTVTWSS